jgi:hypothetical protein
MIRKRVDTTGMLKREAKARWRLSHRALAHPSASVANRLSAVTRRWLRLPSGLHLDCRRRQRGVEQAEQRESRYRCCNEERIAKLRGPFPLHPGQPGRPRCRSARFRRSCMREPAARDAKDPGNSESALLRGRNMPERPEQREVISDLQGAADDQRQATDRGGEQGTGDRGAER